MSAEPEPRSLRPSKPTLSVLARQYQFGAFSLARRRMNQFLRTLKRNLGDPKAKALVTALRDRIYFEAQRHKRADRTGTLVALAGVNGQDGTTTVATLLSLSLGELRGQRILYVDGSFSSLDLAVFRDLFDMDPRDIECCNGFGYLQCHVTEDESLYFLSADRNVASPADFFTHPEFEHFLGGLRSFFDFVVFDMPSLVTATETRHLLPLVDLAYIICKPRHTRYADIEKSKKIAQDVGAKIDGAIINCQRVPFWSSLIGRGSFI
jgi:Mrp family chromosome partitioning ATPase